MKRLWFFAAVALLLSGCTGELDPQWLANPSYAAVHYRCQTSFQHMAGNGSYIVGANLTLQSADRGLYLLVPDGNTMISSFISDYHGLENYDLLGIDDENCIWIAGHNSENHGLALQLNLNGQVLSTLDFGENVCPTGIFSFTWDPKYYYFLVQFLSVDTYGTQFLVFDRQGNPVFSQSLPDLCAPTQGYLPRESEWAEELEGRDEDYLMSMLFPDGPINDVVLTRLQDGSPTVLIFRKSPIDGECYGIICPIRENFSIEPVYSYSVDLTSGMRLGIPIPSPDPSYDLLIANLDGLLGIQIQEQASVPLASWDTLNYPVMELAYLYAPNALLQSALGSDGVWLCHLDTDSACNIYSKFFPIS